MRAAISSLRWKWSEQKAQSLSAWEMSGLSGARRGRAVGAVGSGRKHKATQGWGRQRVLVQALSVSPCPRPGWDLAAGLGRHGLKPQGPRGLAGLDETVRALRLGEEAGVEGPPFHSLTYAGRISYQTLVGHVLNALSPLTAWTRTTGLSAGPTLSTSLS